MPTKKKKNLQIRKQITQILWKQKPNYYYLEIFLSHIFQTANSLYQIPLKIAKNRKENGDWSIHRQRIPTPNNKHTEWGRKKTHLSRKTKNYQLTPKTNRDLKLGYQSKQPKISTKTSRYSIFTQNRTKPNDFVNRKMRTTTSSACSAACFWRNVTEFALARTSLVPSSLVCSKP